MDEVYGTVSDSKKGPAKPYIMLRELPSRGLSWKGLSMKHLSCSSARGRYTVEATARICIHRAASSRSSIPQIDCVIRPYRASRPGGKVVNYVKLLSCMETWRSVIYTLVLPRKPQKVFLWLSTDITDDHVAVKDLHNHCGEQIAPIERVVIEQSEWDGPGGYALVSDIFGGLRVVQILLDSNQFDDDPGPPTTREEYAPTANSLRARDMLRLREVGLDSSIHGSLPHFVWSVPN